MKAAVAAATAVCAFASEINEACDDTATSSKEVQHNSTAVVLQYVSFSLELFVICA
eukprot:COSAG05_NODE_7576_length_795_cov_1.021552_1_plen_55_part_10